MPFNNNDLEWNKADPKPPQSKIDAGWNTDEKPPASFFNWFFNRTATAIKDLLANAIHKDQRNAANGIAPLDASLKVPTANLPDASTAAKGQTQLSSATNSTSAVLAATPAAVKVAYDLANGKYSKPSTGVPKTDLESAVQSSLNKADSALQTVNGATTTTVGLVQLNDATDSTSVTQAATANALRKAWELANGRYSRPAAGIPKTDLESGVQSSLNKADSALQSVPNASTTIKGIAQLSDDTNSTSTILAATANAVKKVWDMAALKYSKPTGGIPKTDLDSTTQNTLAKADSALQSVQDASTTVKGITQLSDATNSTSVILAATANAVKKAWDLANGKYTKPSTGVPKTDLESAVQTSLGKADSALQSATKATVGLGSVENYGIATQAEAEAGTSNIKYMTPLRVQQEVAKFTPKNVPGGYAGLDENGFLYGTPRYQVLEPGNTRIWTGTPLPVAGNSPWTKILEVRLNVAGVVRIGYRFRTYADTGSTAKARIYKNGVPFGIERVLTGPSSPTTVIQTFEEDMLVSPGDIFSFWATHAGNNYGTSFEDTYVSKKGDII